MGESQRLRLLQLTLIVLLWRTTEGNEGLTHAHARRSCREHFLAGNQQSGVFPLRLHHSAPEFNVECRMPPSGNLPSTVLTVVHSALERGVKVTNARTVQWQVDNFELLDDLLKRNHCRQTIYVNRTLEEEMDKNDGSGLMLISILGEQTYLAPDKETAAIELTGRAAGILHIVPDVSECDKLPLITVSELVCEESLLKYDECLIDGGVQVDVTGSIHSHFRFAFRTDVSDQTLFVAHLKEPAGKVHADLTGDFFLSIGPSSAVSAPLHPIGHLNDGQWHTAQVALDGTHMSIDGGPKITLPDFGAPVTSVHVRMNGLVMLIDQVTESGGCGESNAKLYQDRQPSHTRPFCAGASPCECTLLPDLFHNLPASSCVHEEEDEANGLQLLRHSDYLSFLFIEDALSSFLPLRLALTFKSDSDSGLLFFGEWRNVTWGRLQMHYHGRRLTAVHCVQADENSNEECTTCSIENEKGFDTDSWHKVVLFDHANGAFDERYLAVDRSVCKLVTEQSVKQSSAITAEVYKTGITKGSVLFVGGMFNKKVLLEDVYRKDFQAKYFENTREKLPTLRGCIKDIFVSGKRVDIVNTFSKQVDTSLVFPKEHYYAVKMGCGHCPSMCPLSVRCRPSTPSIDPSFKCDCSDIEEYPNGATCEAQKMPPLSMATSSLSAFRGEYPIARDHGEVAKIWIKIRLPSVSFPQDTPLILFYSHGRRILFRLFLTPTSRIALQVNPIDPSLFISNTTVEVSPSDDRIHLISITRRTPLGTNPNKRQFELNMDGTRYLIDDPAMDLTSIEFSLLDLPPQDAGCVQDIGVSFDYNEHKNIENEKNKIETFNVHKEMVYMMGIMPGSADSCGVLDPLFWMDGGRKTAPFGALVEYSPNVFMGQSGGALSSEWFVYSIILTVVLALILLLCLCLYFCCLRRKKTNRRRNSDDDRERMVKGDSPDYPVILRKPLIGADMDRDSNISDSLDRTDISAYDDVKVHKVKVDRESMISFLEPSTDRADTAYMVMRSPSPPNDDPAPLVRINEFERQ